MQDLKSYVKFDVGEFCWADEAEMMRRIQSGEKLVYPKEMTRQYYFELAFLLLAQMDSEYVGAYGYAPITYIAPRFDVDEIRHVPQIVHDEFIHGTRIRDVLNGIEFDADRWMEERQPEYSFRLGPEQKLSTSIPSARLTQDFRVNIFYYPIVIEGYDLITWINFTTFQFVQDRGAGEQLQDAIRSSHKPWAHENGKIMREENRHIAHGEKWMAELFHQYPELVQPQFDLWWPRVLATFGKPNSSRNELWRKLGLKQRTNEEVLSDFLKGERGIYAANEAVGLKIPPFEEVMAMWRQGDYLKAM